MTSSAWNRPVRRWSSTHGRKLRPLVQAVECAVTRGGGSLGPGCQAEGDSPMDLVLGLSVTSTAVRWVLVEGAAGDGDAVDRGVLDVIGDSMFDADALLT